jgi:hypothetical protein
MKGRIALKTKKLIVLAIVACNATSCATMSTAPQPSLNQALTAPASDLAQGYLWVKFVTQYALPTVETGGNIQLGSEAINKSNVSEYQRKYQERYLIYRKAIKQRGYRTISGTYSGTTTEACARVRSTWVSLIREGSAKSIEIQQDGFDAQLIISAEYKGKKLDIRNKAAVVESGIALQDAMNSDYFFRGTIKNDTIEIQPDVSVLQSWPKWANPPSQQDLETCIVTLTVTRIR